MKQIIVPTTNSYTLQLQIPDRMIGKKVAVIYDEEEIVNRKEISTASFFKASDIFKDCRINLSTYKFNRDEANNYE